MQGNDHREMHDVTHIRPREPRLLRDSTLRDEDEQAADAERSHFKRYDQRLEDWMALLEDEAGQRYWLAALEAEAGERSYEVLSALAARARDVAECLETMAERASARGDPASPEPSAHLLQLKPRRRQGPRSGAAMQSA